VDVVVFGQVTVVAPPARTNLALALAEAADRAATWPGLGRREPGPLRLILVEGGDAFGAAAPGRVPEWGAGLALPGARTIVIRADGGGNPFQTLRHELAHLALHEAVRVRLPLWFSEGYAVIAAGEFGRLQALQLNLSLAGGRVPTFRELDRELRATQLEAQQAYALAGTAVAYLARRHPQGTLDALIGHLEAGVRFEEAVLLATGLTMDRFEIAWQRDTKRRYGLVVWLVAGGGWLIAGLLLIVGIALRRRRDRPRRAALDIGWPPPPPEEPETMPELDRSGDPR
jgi:hypothetical protein